MKFFRTALILVLSACLLAACTGKGAALTETPELTEENVMMGETEPAAQETEIAGGRIDAIKKRGRLVVAMSMDYPPFEFIVVRDGVEEIAGFDVGLAEEIADALGVSLDLQNALYDSLLTGLLNDEYDMVISAMAPTSERKQYVDFSKEYFRYELCIAAHTDMADRFSSFADLKRTRVGIHRQVLHETEFQDAAAEDINWTAYDRYDDLISDVLGRGLDAACFEKAVAAQAIKRHPEIVILPADVKVQDSVTAVALKKGQPELIALVNGVIDELIASGRMDEHIADALYLNELVDED